jgi:hypothetical protein
MIDAGRQVEAVTGELGIPWDSSGYVPLAEWRPCPAHTPKAPDFDLYMITAKAPYHALTATGSNPLLNEVGFRLGYDEIALNRVAGKRKGLKDGDWVEVETDSGKKARGRVKLTSAIHPEVTAVWGSAGRWARGATQNKDSRGIHFKSQHTQDDEHMDFFSAAVDFCLRVKITKLKKELRKLCRDRDQVRFFGPVRGLVWTVMWMGSSLNLDSRAYASACRETKANLFFLTIPRSRSETWLDLNRFSAVHLDSHPSPASRRRRFGFSNCAANCNLIRD